MKVKRAPVVVLTLALLITVSAVAPVLAIGPNKAADVGNNPNLVINPANQKTYLNTPCGDKSALDRNTWYGNTIFLYLNASNNNGIINNAIIADINTVKGMISNPKDFSNKWIYLSGENNGNTYNNPTDSPDVGLHGMFYWWIRLGAGFSHEDALASIAARNPDGGLVKLNFVGP